MTHERRSPIVIPCRILLLILGMAVLSTACSSSQATRRYYALSLNPHPPVVAQAQDAEVWVRESEVSPVYNRAQVVYRVAPTELQYYSLHAWADRPARMISQNLETTLRGSGIFRSVTSRLGSSTPTFVLGSTVLAMEMLAGGGTWYAHVSLELRLTRFSDEAPIWQYRIDQRRPLASPDVGLMVRAVSEVLEEQLEIAYDDLAARLEGRPPSRKSAAPPPQAPVDRAGEEVRNAAEPGAFDWTKSAQYASDPTVVPTGLGAIFLPALSGYPSRESPVEVYRGEEWVMTGSMGRRIPVPPGVYRVHYGSGALSQRMTVEVVVEANRVAVVQPTWSALEVEVVNEAFVPFRASYELIDMTTREFVGVGYGADEELGEETQIWVLRPGLYKIVQPGANYRTRTNFATVLLPVATAIPFTLVISDDQERNFLGAGVSEQEDIEEEADKRWSLRSTLGGDVVWQANSEGSSLGAGTTVGLGVYSDNLLRYRNDKHLWTTRFEFEEGFNLEGEGRLSRDWFEASRGVSTADRIYGNSVYIYELRGWVGPYARLGGESLLQKRYKTFDLSDGGEPPRVEIRDPSGNLVTEEEGLSRVLQGGAFSPLTLKQGGGFNFRLLHNSLLDLDLRVGIGGRQTIQNGYLEYLEESTRNLAQFQALSNAYLVGPETTVVGSGRITRYVQVSTELDALLPVLGGSALQFTWRSSASLRLSSYASLQYSLDLDQNPNVGREQPLVIDQRLQLRLAWSVF